MYTYNIHTLDNERLNWMEPANSQYNIIELNSSLDGRYQLISEQISSRNVSSKLNRLNVTKAILFSKLNHNKTRFSSIKHDGRLKTTTYVRNVQHFGTYVRSHTLSQPTSRPSAETRFLFSIYRQMNPCVQ